ncbi:hypothetical protein GFY24_13040 [Nocardia sp. SYP-A9097]|uniref:hypothetical protein n=1 Tax=Nocardia sp. SYP-A9097 TaxID=2663237 RepID=UPI00129AB06B|nr:hypothetical protein [Nocardia sp. SYP-A9097]MRH88358.1 hypothetical protein [Nocardia sp. SYP-A9097]
MTRGEAVVETPGSSRRGLRSRYGGPAFGPVGFVAAVAGGLFFEVAVLVDVPYWVFPLFLIPAGLISLPSLCLRQIGMGVFAAWLAVPFGVVTAPVLVIVGLIGGIRLAGGAIARRYDNPGRAREVVERKDFWAAGALWMSPVVLASLLLTWRISGGTTPVVPSRGELAADGMAFAVAAGVLCLAALFAVFGWGRGAFGSGPRALRRGTALALVAGALLTPAAWHIASDAFTDEVKHDPRGQLAEMGIDVPADYRFREGRNWCSGFQDLACHVNYRFTAGRGRFDSYQELFRPDSDLPHHLLPLTPTSCPAVNLQWEIHCELTDSAVAGSYASVSLLLTRSAQETTLVIAW